MALQSVRDDRSSPTHSHVKAAWTKTLLAASKIRFHSSACPSQTVYNRNEARRYGRPGRFKQRDRDE